MISALLDKAIRRRIFWWQRRDHQPNAGDELARVIVEALLRLRDLSPYANGVFGRKRLFSIGSVVHFARDNDCVWGSGINGKIDKSLHRFRTLDVRAVRGPRTADFLRARNISVPPVFGDPGLLAPLIYPWRRQPVCSEKIIYVPHMNDRLDSLPLKAMVERGVTMCSPLQGPGSFIASLLFATKVVSKSLHGLVLAEAFGIPAVRICGSEPDFKYVDYYEGTERFDVPFASTFQDAIELEAPRLPDIDAIQKRLLASFPYDLWSPERQ